MKSEIFHRNGSAKVNGGKSQWGEMMRLALDMANSPPDGLVISHFASFLNVQMETTERSVFCNSAVVGDELRGFKNVVVDFNLTMAQDFSSRSIEISGRYFISSCSHNITSNCTSIQP